MPLCGELNFRNSVLSKVHKFWEGHKIWKEKIPIGFDVTKYVMSKRNTYIILIEKSGRFLKKNCGVLRIFKLYFTRGNLLSLRKCIWPILYSS